MSAAQPAVEMRGVSKRFGQVEALNDVSFSLGLGSCLGLVGPNGAGKTTALRILAGLISRFDGQALIGGTDARSVSPNRGVLIEQPALYPYLSVQENLEFLASVAGRGTEAVASVIEGVRLEHATNRKAGTLSHGNKQRLGLATALLSDPQVLLLDEPLTGLDPAGQIQIRRLLAGQVQSGVAVVVSSHNLAEVESLAQQLLFLSSGKVIAAGEASEFITDQVVQLRFDDSATAQRQLEGMGYQVTATPDGAIRVPIVESLDTTSLVKALAQAGLYPKEVVLQRRSLEDAYVQLLGDADRDD